MTAVSLVSAASPRQPPAATIQRLLPVRPMAARHTSAAVAKNAIGPSSSSWRVTITW